MTSPADGLTCPTDLGAASKQITLAHGEGGRLMRRLIREHIVPRLQANCPHTSEPSNTALGDLADAARLTRLQGPIVFTTDSYVVTPLFFPGGDIGELAVNGTVNDLVVSGAIPRWLSLSFIAEEGLSLELLDRVLDSVARAARFAGVEIVTGDTKVVPKGAADRLFVTTSGLGELVEPAPPGPAALTPGDVLIVSGPIARHGIAILSARENLGFEPAPQSDCAPLTAAFAALRAVGCPVRAARDATRGGVAAVCHEWAEASRLTLTLEERQIPLTAEVRGACELLGLDPLFLANEGTMLLAVPPTHVNEMLQALATVDVSRNAAVIGSVCPRKLAPVTVCGMLGIERPLDEPEGMLLPRIC